MFLVRRYDAGMLAPQLPFDFLVSFLLFTITRTAKTVAVGNCDVVECRVPAAAKVERE